MLIVVFRLASRPLAAAARFRSAEQKLDVSVATAVHAIGRRRRLCHSSSPPLLFC